MISNFYNSYKCLIFTENFWYEQVYNHIKSYFLQLIRSEKSRSVGFNMLFSDSVREMAADQFTASYDRLYAVKEHDIEGNMVI